MLDAAKALWAMLAKLTWFQWTMKNWMLAIPLTAILSSFALILINIDNAISMIAFLKECMGSGGAWRASTNMAAKVNVIIPIVPLFCIAFHLLALKLICMLIRWVKSWIPTVN